MSEKYLYEVRPIRPVVHEGRFTRRPFSSELTLEEVLETLPKAHVFRRFADLNKSIPVTGGTAKELHRARYAEAAPAEPNKTGEPVAVLTVDPEPVKEESKVEEPVAETKPEPVVEEKKEEEAAVEEAPAEEVAAPEVVEEEQKVEEPAKEEVAVEEPVSDSEESSEGEVEKVEEIAESEAEDASEAEKEVSDEVSVEEDKPSNVINVPNNSNKFHKKNKR